MGLEPWRSGLCAGTAVWLSWVRVPPKSQVFQYQIPPQNLRSESTKPTSCYPNQALLCDLSASRMVLAQSSAYLPGACWMSHHTIALSNTSHHIVGWIPYPLYRRSNDGRIGSLMPPIYSAKQWWPCCGSLQLAGSTAVTIWIEICWGMYCSVLWWKERGNYVAVGGTVKLYVLRER